MLKDRRKDWQKTCINWAWSRCGTVATMRGEKEQAKRSGRFFDGGGFQTKFVWYDEEEKESLRKAAFGKIKLTFNERHQHRVT
jgi:hypothetical protein